MRFVRHTLLAALLCAVAATPSVRGDGGPGLPIDHGLWSLRGTDPTLPDDDLEPLRRVVAGASYVGLGEAIHTSGGFYRMKDRVFRFLVQEMGFRAIGWESNWIRAERAETFVQTCAGTARDAVRGVANVWQSTEVEALLQWMCDWNTAHPDDRVHFYGFDIQAQAFQNGAALIAFLRRLDTGDEDPRLEGIRVCDGVEVDWFFAGLPFPPELYEQCQAALAATAAYFDAAETDIEKLTSPEDLAWARVHLVGLQAWQEEIFFLETDPDRAGKARDRGMAYVAQAIHDLRFPHARTALWAHNGHLAKNGSTGAYFGVDMGTHLAADLGDRKYTAIGLLAREIHLDWFFIGACGLDPLPEDERSIERLFDGLGAGEYVLADLDAQPPFLEPGAEYTLASVPMVPAEHFDALIHLHVSPKMNPLAWPSCE